MLYFDLGDVLAVAIGLVFGLMALVPLKRKIAELEEDLRQQRQNFFHHLDRGE